MFYSGNIIVQLLSCVWLFATMWTSASQASLSFTISQGLLKLMCIELVMPSKHLIFCHPLLQLPSIFPSIRVFSNESILHIRGPKYWSFSISPPNEYSGLVSFRIHWLDLLAVQGTLKSLLQHHSSKASIRQCSAFFMIQLSHSYMTTGKIMTLTRGIFIGKVMSLLFNMLSRLVTENPMDCSMPGCPVHYQLQELAQTHIHPVSDAIQPSHPLSTLSPAFSVSQHQGLLMSRLFESDGQSIGASASSQSFQWIFRTGFL